MGFFLKSRLSLTAHVRQKEENQQVSGAKIFHETSRRICGPQRLGLFHIHKLQRHFIVAFPAYGDHRLQVVDFF